MGETHIWGQTTNGTRIGHINPTTKGRKTCIPKNVGTLLYYSRAVEPTTMVALGYISDNLVTSNRTTTQAIKQLLG